MTSQEEFSLPPLDADGRVDLLTGLDAPEIFYRFLSKAILSTRRDSSRRVALLRVRLGIEPLRRARNKISDSGLSFRVVQFAEVLRSQTRSDEQVVRIGEVTFLILARVRDVSEVEAMSSRFISAIADAKFDRDSNLESVDSSVTVERGSSAQAGDQSIDIDIAGYPFEVFMDTYLHIEGEEMLEFLERVGV